MTAKGGEVRGWSDGAKRKEDSWTIVGWLWGEGRAGSPVPEDSGCGRGATPSARTLEGGGGSSGPVCLLGLRLGNLRFLVAFKPGFCINERGWLMTRPLTRTVLSQESKVPMCRWCRECLTCYQGGLKKPVRLHRAIEDEEGLGPQVRVPSR